MDIPLADVSNAKCLDGSYDNNGKARLVRTIGRCLDEGCGDIPQAQQVQCEVSSPETSGRLQTCEMFEWIMQKNSVAGDGPGYGLALTDRVVYTEVSVKCEI